MRAHYTVLALLLPLVANAADKPKHCQVYNGRFIPDAVPSDLEDFDPKLAYDPGRIHGSTLKWKDVLRFPPLTTSLFEEFNQYKNMSTKAVEVTIDDKSIYEGETAIRRTQLVPVPPERNRIVTTTMSLYFSIRLDPARPLNYSHEYTLVAMQLKDYSKNQWTLSTGTSLNPAVAAKDPKSLQVRGPTSADVPQKLLYETPFSEGWHNFKISLHFFNNSMQVSHSTGWKEPQISTPVVPADLSGKGEYHFGLLKKPTGEQLKDITTEGYQESGIDEGVLFGGIHIMDNTNRGCTFKGEYDPCCYNVGDLPP